MGKNLAQRLFAYLTDFGDRDFCRKYNSFLKEFMDKEERKSYISRLTLMKSTDIAANTILNTINAFSITTALYYQELFPLMIIPGTELFRITAYFKSVIEKKVLLGIRKNKIALHRYESLEQIQREYNKRTRK